MVFSFIIFFPPDKCKKQKTPEKPSYPHIFCIFLQSVSAPLPGFLSNSILLSFPGQLPPAQEHYSTVTDFARFLGLSTSRPLATLT